MIKAMGRLVLIVFMVLLAPPLFSEANAAAGVPIRVGLLPTLPTLSLLRLYDPLRQYLEMELGRPVELYTSAGFRLALDDISTEAFDIVITAPHFGVVAVDKGYVPVSRYKAELRPLVVVPKGSAIKNPSQLRGRRVLTADRLAALSVVAEHWLQSDYGLNADTDYILDDVGNHATGIRAVAVGDADAAFSSASALQQLSPDIRDRVDFFPARLAVPHQFTLAHSRLGPETILALRGALARFGTTDLGRRFFKLGGFQGFAPLEDADIDRARPYAELVLNRIRRGN
jgi:phosphonate transport system substrate-binding protein